LCLKYEIDRVFRRKHAVHTFVAGYFVSGCILYIQRPMRLVFYYRVFIFNILFLLFRLHINSGRATFIKKTHRAKNTHQDVEILVMLKLIEII